MSDSTQVSLPQSVEQLINKICEEQNQPQPDAVPRQALAALGEEAALELLRVIAGSKIRQTFAGFIMHLIKKHSSSNNNNNGSPSKRLCISSPSNQNRSPTATRTRPINPFPVMDDTVNRTLIPQYVALGELEFRKAFIILSYIGEKRLEDVTTADQILNLKHLPMSRFESKAWDLFGRKCINIEDRLKSSIDWDSGKTHIYHCHVSPDGNCTFKGPYLNNRNTHFQRVLGDDNILMVKFSEDGTRSKSCGIGYSDNYAMYNKFAREGILVGLRRYRFFVFKDGGKEEKKKDPTTSAVKCYFVRLESDASIDKGQNYVLSGKSVHDARAMFMHVHTVPNVANYMSRLSLILSNTRKLDIDLTSVNVERIDDIPCCDKDGNVFFKDGKQLIHTDGTGFISEDLAIQCPQNLFKGKSNSDDNNKRFTDKKEFEGKLSEMNRPESHNGEPPLLMQVRLFNKGCAVKGTLLVNKKLPPRTIQVRPSMIKVEADPDLSDTQTFNSLEVVKTSNRPNRTYLSKALIALLSYGGVPDTIFEDILMSALEDTQGVISNKRNALKVCLNHDGIYDSMAARMILSGIFLDEPCLQYFLSILSKVEMKNLQGGKLPLPESYYLMGTVDPTGILKSDEVCIILNDGQVSWEKVLVYRNPGLHFGDVHVLKATYVKELEDIVGNAKYAIFFPCQGPRSLGAEIANGDFDGDMYFLSRNPELLKHFKESEPWTSNSSTSNVSNKKPPRDCSPEELEDELFKLFLTTRFQQSPTVGVAAESWQAIMDRLLTLGDESADEKAHMKENMCRLIQIYYDALDAPKKSGTKIDIPPELKVERYPSYIGKHESISFESGSILGKIYDRVKSYELEDLSIKDIWKLPCFDNGVSEACKAKWEGLHKQYRGEMTAACNLKTKEERDEAAEEVIERYKHILYGCAEFEQSTRSVEEIYEEALAIYHVSYDYAKYHGDVKKCSFAWKVAGAALCSFYASKQSERSMVCVPSALKEILGC